MRQGVTLVELIVVVLILAVSAAVAVPNWLQYQESATASAAAMAVSADLQALRSLAQRTSQSFTVQITDGDSALCIQPAIPTFLGDRSGKVNYSNRYPNCSFKNINFSGVSSFVVDMRGDLLSPSTLERLTVASMQVFVGQSHADVTLQLEQVNAPDTTPIEPADTSGSTASPVSL